MSDHGDESFPVTGRKYRQTSMAEMEARAVSRKRGRDAEAAALVGPALHPRARLGVWHPPMALPRAYPVRVFKRRPVIHSSPARVAPYRSRYTPVQVARFDAARAAKEQLRRAFARPQQRYSHLMRYPLRSQVRSAVGVKYLLANRRPGQKVRFSRTSGPYLTPYRRRQKLSDPDL